LRERAASSGRNSGASGAGQQGGGGPQHRMSFAGLTALGEMKKSSSQKSLIKVGSLKPMPEGHGRGLVKSPPPNGPKQNMPIGTLPSVGAPELGALGPMTRAASSPAGHFPSGAQAESSRQAQEVREQLAQCLEDERYEEAAVLRDRLRALGESFRRPDPASSPPHGALVALGRVGGSWKGPETPTSKASRVSTEVRKALSWRGELPLSSHPSPHPGSTPGATMELSTSS